MEESKKMCHEQENNKMVIKLSGGGGIGAVVLLAGALATTAVASAFIVGRNRRKSGEKKQHHQMSPPPTVGSHESLGHYNPSSEATNMVEAENDTAESAVFVSTECTIQDEKPKLEINGGEGDAAYSNEETLCCNSLKKLESSAISVDRFYVPILDENLQFKPESIKNHQVNPVNGEDKQVEGDPVDDEEISAVKYEAVETIDADQTVQELQMSGGKTDMCCDREEGDRVYSNKIIEEKYNQQIQVNIEQNRVGGHGDDGENAKVDKTAGGRELDEEKKANICSTQEPISTEFSKASENYGEDGHILQPTVENFLLMENSTLNDDNKEGLQVELNAAEEIPCNNDEKIVCIDNTKQANSQDEHVQMPNGSSIFASEIVIVDDPKEELLFAEEIAALKEKADDENRDVKEDNPLMQFVDFQQKEYESEENDIEEIEETTGGEEEEEEEEKVDDIDDECNNMAGEDFADKLDENLEGTGHFSAESNENLDNQEIEGKIEEDKAAREGKYNLHEYNIQSRTENSSIDKYIVELGTQNKPTRKIILIGTVSVVSWISCSWFFGLSFVKLCLIVLFTMVLSKIQGY